MPATQPPSYTPAPVNKPQRGIKDTFSDYVDGFVTWFTEKAPSEIAALAANVYSNTVDAFGSAVAAATSAGKAKTSEDNAAASAAAASVTAGATLWVSGQPVAQDAAKISPLDRRTYRRKTASGSGTTDPALDPTNYVLLSAMTGFPTINVRDERPAGTVGGTATAGSWVQRVLNTVKSNTITGASLSANQITLPAGTYEYDGSAPGVQCDGHRIRLWNVTDVSVIDTGTNANSYNTAVCTHSHVSGVFTIASQKTIEIQHRLVTVNGAYALGSASGVAPELYAEITLRKIG